MGHHLLEKKYPPVVDRALGDGKGQEKKGGKKIKRKTRGRNARAHAYTTHACIACMHAWDRRDIVGRLERGERICGVARHATCQQSVNVHGQVSFHSRVKGCFPFSFLSFFFLSSLRSLSLRPLFFFFFFSFPFPSLLELLSSAI